MYKKRDIFGSEKFKKEISEYDKKMREENPLIVTDTPVCKLSDVAEILVGETKKEWEAYQSKVSDGYELEGVLIEVDGSKDFLIGVNDKLSLPHEDNHSYLKRKWKRAKVPENQFIKEGLGFAISELVENENKIIGPDYHGNEESIKKRYEQAKDLSKYAIKNFGLQTATFLARDSVIEAEKNNLHPVDVYEKKIMDYVDSLKMIFN